VSAYHLKVRPNSRQAKKRGIDQPAIACRERSIGPDPAGTGGWCNGDVGLISV